VSATVDRPPTTASNLGDDDDDDQLSLKFLPSFPSSLVDHGTNRALARSDRKQQQQQRSRKKVAHRLQHSFDKGRTCIHPAVRDRYSNRQTDRQTESSRRTNFIRRLGASFRANHAKSTNDRRRRRALELVISNFIAWTYSTFSRQSCCQSLERDRKAVRRSARIFSFVDLAIRDRTWRDDD